LVTAKVELISNLTRLLAMLLSQLFIFGIHTVMSRSDSKPKPSSRNGNIGTIIILIILVLAMCLGTWFAIKPPTPEVFVSKDPIAPGVVNTIMNLQS
jgi:hypothetical protein